MRLSFTSVKLFVLFILGSFVINSLSGQQNGGFENWSPSGSPPPFDWLYPTGWTTNNASTEFITAGVVRNTYHYSGEFSAQIKTLNIFGTYTRSQLALGNCQLDFANYQIKGYTGGEALIMVPHQISFYYQLTTGNPFEYAVADILIKRPSGNSNPDTVFYKSIPLVAVDIFTRMDLLIPDSGINTATDSIVILFSSNDVNEIAQNILYVDDVSIDFANAVDPTPSGISPVCISPNPVRSGESLTINLSLTKIQHLQILDSTGKIMQCCNEMVGNADRTVLGPIQLPPGIYFVLVNGKYSTRFVVTD